MSSEPLIRDDPGRADDPLAELGDPYDLDDALEDDDVRFDEPAGFDELAADHDDPFRAADAPETEPVLLFWPPEEYEQVDQRWPEVLEPLEADSWEDYRRHCRAMVASWVRRGLTPVSMVTGTADGFAEHLVEQGADPLTVDLLAMADGYAEHLVEQGAAVELPPAPDQPCWCGSGTTYARCCSPHPG